MGSSGRDMPAAERWRLPAGGWRPRDGGCWLAVGGRREMAAGGQEMAAGAWPSGRCPGPPGRRTLRVDPGSDPRQMSPPGPVGRELRASTPPADGRASPNRDILSVEGLEQWIADHVERRLARPKGPRDDIWPGWCGVAAGGQDDGLWSGRVPSPGPSMPTLSDTPPPVDTSSTVGGIRPYSWRRSSGGPVCQPVKRTRSPARVGAQQ
jgi:hypothetical protein